MTRKKTGKRKPAKPPPEPRKPDIRAIHRNIKRLRGELDLTFKELGRRAGVCPTAVFRWEQGLSAPVASRIPAVAVALGVTIDELYAEDAA